MSENRTSNNGYSCEPYYGYDYDYGDRKRKSKTDWAGIVMGDAFKQGLNYYVRQSARRMFYSTVKKAQKTVARLSGELSEESFTPRIKPQIGPCYTTYPANLAVHAAVGLTIFLEHKLRCGANVLGNRLKSYLKNPAQVDDVGVDPVAYQKTVQNVVKWVETRLLLEELSRNSRLTSVEIYRLFMASQENLHFETLNEIIRAVVLFGDIFPDWNRIRLHDFTRQLLVKLAAKSVPYFDALPNTAPSRLLELGEAWTKNLCRALIEYMPDSIEPKDVNKLKTGMLPVQRPAPKPKFTFTPVDSRPPDKIDALNALKPPSLDLPRNAAEKAALKSENSGKDQKIRSVNPFASQLEKKVMSDFSNAVQKAGAQDRQWEDMRSDMVEKTLKNSMFLNGPMEGNPSDGHEVIQRWKDGKETAGEIFDRPVALKDDFLSCQTLEKDAEPIAATLKRNLYPNIEQKPRIIRFRTSGALDPARLAFGDLSQSVFKRYRIEEEADRRGRPVLVIACDGSGSLNASQMKMMKILSTAYLKSTMGTGIKMLSALYHSGYVRQNLSGPLVQWIYHPKKTEASSHLDAVRAVASLPATGTGAQSDALSITFILNEAQQIARGDMVYLVLISDTAWNSSFNSGKSGKEEVMACFDQAYDQFKGKLHTTLVALGVDKETGFEDRLNSIIPVSADDLKDSKAVAEKVGAYVAKCIRERRRFTMKR